MGGGSDGVDERLCCAAAQTALRPARRDTASFHRHAKDRQQVRAVNCASIADTGSLGLRAVTGNLEQPVGDLGFGTSLRDQPVEPVLPRTAAFLARDANFLEPADQVAEGVWPARYSAESDSIQAWRPAQKREVACEKRSSRQDGLAEGPTFPCWRNCVRLAGEVEMGLSTVRESLSRLRASRNLSTLPRQAASQDGKLLWGTRCRRCWKPKLKTSPPVRSAS
jgi:hypothetical protein